jgi:hypothetical protein
VQEFKEQPDTGQVDKVREAVPRGSPVVVVLPMGRGVVVAIEVDGGEVIPA